MVEDHLFPFYDRGLNELAKASVVERFTFGNSVYVLCPTGHITNYRLYSYVTRLGSEYFCHLKEKGVKEMKLELDGVIIEGPCLKVILI